MSYLGLKFILKEVILMSDLLTPEQMCARYKISKWTLYQWTSNDYIPYIKIRGLLRFNVDEIQDWEKRISVKVNLI